jgi:hypothetical protein
MAKQLEWDVAEVLDYDYTYQYIASDKENSTTNKLFGLKVRSASGYFNDKPFLAKPSNINMKQIPLVGEFVLIYKTFNQESAGHRWRESWYYVTSIDVQSSINSNMLPGLSNGDEQENIDATKPGKTFVNQVISPIQPYEGDLIVEGRFGNSIRFGSSIDQSKNTSNYYYKQPKWYTPGNYSDPIIILSNGRTNLPDKEFVIEDIDNDKSSIYLTSTQVIDFTLSRSLSKYNTFAGSQLLGNANRIILRANTDVAVIDSEKGIILNTPGDVRIGNDRADQPLVHGQVLYDIIRKLITAISLGTTAEGTMKGLTELAAIQTDLTNILSTKYFIENTAVPIPN